MEKGEGENSSERGHTLEILSGVEEGREGREVRITSDKVMAAERRFSNTLVVHALASF